MAKKGKDRKVKAVAVLRKDIGISTGKAVAQGGHGFVFTSLGVEKTSPKIMDKWNDNLGTKIVLESYSLEEIKWIQYAAKRKGIPHFLIVDAGKTEIAPETVTGIVLGPYYADAIDSITGTLKMYSDEKLPTNEDIKKAIITQIAGILYFFGILILWAMFMDKLTNGWFELGVLGLILASFGAGYCFSKIRLK